ncbi:MAG: carboxymuconolactone decarboxylase family protein [Sphingobium sp.]
MTRIAIPDEYSDSPVGSVLAHYAPAIAAASRAYSQAVYQHSSLPFRIIEGARIRTAQINGCQTCQSFRAARDLPASIERAGGDVQASFLGRGDAVPDDAFYDAVADWRTASAFDERERLAIELAERMGLSPQSFEEDDAFWARMKAHFTDAEIVDLVMSVSCWIGAGRALHVLEIDPRICAIPELAAG